MKKLMILGGSKYIIPVIQRAQELDIYVITVDYLDWNYAHKYSDEYLNISVIDKEAVLKAAREKEIDGIISFACDPGVVTAAYVAENMNIPFQGSYNSVCTLQDKGKFRSFLRENGFNCPISNDYEDKEMALSDIDTIKFPVMVKPVDSAGSKGVNKASNKEEYIKAIDIALEQSINGGIIVEEYIEFDGNHSSADLFTIDGELKFVTFSDQLFDISAENPYTPVNIIWPSTMKQNNQKYLTEELKRLIKILRLKTGIYNVETCVGTDGKPYIMEMSPRGGGCKIAEIQKLAYGIDLIDREIKSAVGMQVEDISEYECHGVWCEMVVHASEKEQGILDSIVADTEIMEKSIKVFDMAAHKGAVVKPLTGANMALGDIFLNANTREEMDKLISTYREWLHINLK